MPENRTIPDPGLTREEAEALIDAASSVGFLSSGPSIDDEGRENWGEHPSIAKLRSALSTPPVEQGGMEEVVAKWLGDHDELFRPDEVTREEARDLLAAIQPFLAQPQLSDEERERLERIATLIDDNARVISRDKPHSGRELKTHAAFLRKLASQK